MLGEDPGDEGYDDPYEEESQTVQTIILPGTDLVSFFFLIRLNLASYHYIWHQVASKVPHCSQIESCIK